MNLETLKTIGPVMTITFLVIPWIIGVLFLLISWFGEGLSSGNVATQHFYYEKLITECEENLPRNEQCELVAQKTRR